MIQEILQDINEFNISGLTKSLFWCAVCLILAYIAKPDGSTENWWKHWKALAVFFIIIWLIVSRIMMGRPFVKEEHFKSLIKIEGILHYTDDDGFFIVPPYTSRSYPIELLLCTNNLEDISKYENQHVAVWQKNHIVYQFEYNENVIYSLERSNSKVWLGVIWDLIWNYLGSFCYLLTMYVGLLNNLKDLKENSQDH